MSLSEQGPPYSMNNHEPPTQPPVRPFIYGRDAMSLYISIDQQLRPEDITRWNIPFLSTEKCEEMWWSGVNYLELNTTKYTVTLPLQDDSGIRRDLMRTNIKGVYWQVTSRIDPLLFYNNLIIANTSTHPAHAERRATI